MFDVFAGRLLRRRLDLVPLSEFWKAVFQRHKDQARDPPEGHLNRECPDKVDDMGIVVDDNMLPK